MTETERLADRLEFLASGQDDPHSVALAEAAAELRRLSADAQRFQSLQNMPVKDAQAFFWNYSSRKARAAAIDQAMKEPT